MLGQIANFCYVVSRKEYSLQFISYGRPSGNITNFNQVDFSSIHLNSGDRPEDLIIRLMSFVEDNLLTQNGHISNHDEIPEAEEELFPTLAYLSGFELFKKTSLQL